MPPMTTLRTLTLSAGASGALLACALRLCVPSWLFAGRLFSRPCAGAATEIARRAVSNPAILMARQRDRRLCGQKRVTDGILFIDSGPFFLFTRGGRAQGQKAEIRDPRLQADRRCPRPWAAAGGLTSLISSRACMHRPASWQSRASERHRQHWSEWCWVENGMDCTSGMIGA